MSHIIMLNYFLPCVYFVEAKKKIDIMQKERTFEKAPEMDINIRFSDRVLKIMYHKTNHISKMLSYIIIHVLESKKKTITTFS